LNWHYIIPRHITIQEAAILQSFPEDYKFIGSISKNKERIGNLVPPLFMKAVAENIRINILEKAVKINGRI
jgi:DNA (cytosine-5)-methyltransferase 1